MQQLITLRLDVSPLIYHQQSGALSHSSSSRDLAYTHTLIHTHSVARMFFLEQSRFPDYPGLMHSVASVDV